MTPPAGSAPPFQVTYPGTVRQALASLFQQADRIGIKPQVLSAIRAIDDRLQQDPLHFGEPNYGLKVFEVRVAVVPPLAVHFGVDEANRLVIVSGVKALPSSGL